MVKVTVPAYERPQRPGAAEPRAGPERTAPHSSRAANAGWRYRARREISNATLVGVCVGRLATLDFARRTVRTRRGRIHSFIASIHPASRAVPGLRCRLGGGRRRSASTECALTLAALAAVEHEDSGAGETDAVDPPRTASAGPVTFLDADHRERRPPSRAATAASSRTVLRPRPSRSSRRARRRQRRSSRPSRPSVVTEIGGDVQHVRARITSPRWRRPSAAGLAVVDAHALDLRTKPATNDRTGLIQDCRSCKLMMTSAPSPPRSSTYLAWRAFWRTSGSPSPCIRGMHVSMRALPPRIDADWRAPCQRVCRWGSGPAVLLVHGAGAARASRLSARVRRSALEGDAPLVAFDASTGNGDGAGDQDHRPRVRRHHLDARRGALSAASTASSGHSLGAIATRDGESVTSVARTGSGHHDRRASTTRPRARGVRCARRAPRRTSPG